MDLTWFEIKLVKLKQSSLEKDNICKRLFYKKGLEFTSFPCKNLQFAILPRNEFGTKLQVGKQAHMLI